jgi:uncharacterized protein (TIGR02145 family)
MSISTELTRMAGNVGALAADTNAIFEALRAKGVTVPSGATLDDVVEMIESIEVPISSVEIGGRSYPVVRIGNQLWMTENLDWKANGITIGASSSSTTDPNAMYYNQREDLYGINGNKYGLLYNTPAVSAISNLIPSGWRIPSIQDINNLTTYLGTDYIIKLRTTTGWSNTNGNNESGFSMNPSGGYYQEWNGLAFVNITTAFYMWLSDFDSSTNHEYQFVCGDNTLTRTNPPDRGCSIRLVKDV